MPLYRAELLAKKPLWHGALIHDVSQVLHLPFDYDDGSYARDRSGAHNHGIIYGATLATGKIGMSRSFDGVDDYVDCGDIDEAEGVTRTDANSYMDLSGGGFTGWGFHRVGWDLPFCFKAAYMRVSVNSLGSSYGGCLYLRSMQHGGEYSLRIETDATTDDFRLYRDGTKIASEAVDLANNVDYVLEFMWLGELGKLYAWRDGVLKFSVDDSTYRFMDRIYYGWRKSGPETCRFTQPYLVLVSV